VVNEAEDDVHYDADDEIDECNVDDRDKGGEVVLQVDEDTQRRASPLPSPQEAEQKPPRDADNARSSLPRVLSIFDLNDYDYVKATSWYRWKCWRRGLR
jgi:hypothetical protein